jgi:hypothetical protein
VVWANLHNRELVIKAVISTFVLSTDLIFLDLSVATSWDEAGSESHILGVLEITFAETTILVAESLALSVWVPVIMGLIMSMVLVKGVVQVTVNPRDLRIHTQEEWHLGVLIGLIVVPLSDGVEELLVQVRMDDFIAQVVVTLLPIVLREVRRVEVNR